MHPAPAQSLGDMLSGSRNISTHQESYSVQRRDQVSSATVPANATIRCLCRENRANSEDRCHICPIHAFSKGPR